MIITLDGPAGTGKSTVAKQLAQQLGYTYFDTGAMYRAVTYAVMAQSVNYSDVNTLVSFLKTLNFSINENAQKKCYALNGDDVTEAIRGEGVTANVSEISAIPVVRSYCVEIQRQLASKGDAVFEGRDMGTVVFPDAGLKIFLTAQPEVRAQRRLDELRQKGEDVNFDDVLNAIIKRDTYDSSRELSPLRPAEDAYIIDSSTITTEDVIAKIVDLLNNPSR